MHWDERQREHVQTLQNQVSHCALYQTSQTPTDSTKHENRQIPNNHKGIKKVKKKKTEREREREKFPRCL